MLGSSRQRMALHIGRVRDQRDKLAGAVGQAWSATGEKAADVRRQAGRRVEPVRRWAGDRAADVGGYARRTLQPRAAQAARSAERGAARLGHSTGARAAWAWRGAQTAAGACRRVLGAAADAASRAGARLRPRPFGDGGLVVLVSLITVVSLAVSVVLGFTLAAWMATAPHDVLLAFGIAVVLGVVFLLLMFLVFASRRERRPRAHAAPQRALASPLPRREVAPQEWHHRGMRDAA